MTDIIIPIVFFATSVLIVYFAIQARTKQNQNEHEERMLALEKGVEIPMSPGRRKNVTSDEDNPKHRNPYIWPIVLISLGTAMIARSMLSGDFDISWSLIPFLIGIGLLVAHQLFQKQKEKREKNEDSSPDHIA
ncbi:MAG: hypothetical protein HN356_06085 [Calditrichaeota bacterium]|jgi:hypothetical protein|nr:hypothetical protein [Calditrichota bacterium]MBT7617182.1 hypothetical protein [Calditrichota bacterium]MBT7787462.1 hypothetical protein [Calditrichota bacterium]